MVSGDARPLADTIGVKARSAFSTLNTYSAAWRRGCRVVNRLLPQDTLG